VCTYVVCMNALINVPFYGNSDQHGDTLFRELWYRCKTDDVKFDILCLISQTKYYCNIKIVKTLHSGFS
jgi:hypothetical protein